MAAALGVNNGNDSEHPKMNRHAFTLLVALCTIGASGGFQREASLCSLVATAQVLLKQDVCAFS